MRRTLLATLALLLALVLAAPVANAHEGVAWVVDCVENLIGSGGAYC